MNVKSNELTAMVGQIVSNLNGKISAIIFPTTPCLNLDRNSNGGFSILNYVSVSSNPLLVVVAEDLLIACRYGGGFGADATGDSYQQAFARARSLLLSHLTEKEQNQILRGTAKRVMRFG